MSEDRRVYVGIDVKCGECGEVTTGPFGTMLEGGRIEVDLPCGHPFHLNGVPG